jgi:UDP:flavonoid glycosyltransferase YjiC (YdhE family)
MRVLFVTWPSRSHFFGLVPLGWAFQAMGHEVRVVSLPGLTEAVAHAGLPPVPVGTDIEDQAGMSRRGGLSAGDHRVRWPADWPRRLATLAPGQQDVADALCRKSLAMADHMAGGVVAFARAWQPSLIVHDSVTLSGPVAGAVLGVPAVASMWGQIGLHRHELDHAGQPRPEYLALFERFGAEPLAGPARWVDPWPDSVQLPMSVPRTPVRYVPYNGPGHMPDWLLEPPGRPRVCITWGHTQATLTGPVLPGLVHDAISAAGELGAEVVLAVTAAQHDALGALPPGVRAVQSLPLHTVLPSCHAVVHQGGAGTALTAAHYGVPQLIFSPRPVQLAIGERLAAAMAARHRFAPELSGAPDAAATVRADVAALLHDHAYRDGARRLSSQMRAGPAPAELVRELAALAAASSGNLRPSGP